MLLFSTNDIVKISSQSVLFYMFISLSACWCVHSAIY